MRHDKTNLHVKCTWSNCEERIAGSSAFHAHQIAHFLDQLARASHSETINCGICQSDLTDLELESALRHIHFHCWVTSLLAIGQQQQSSSNWPRCCLPPVETVVPVFPTPFECSWQGCIFKTNNVAQLYQHVSSHPKEYTERRQPPLHKLKCLWENCTYWCTRIVNLTYHLRIHTQEKVIGCPDCGILFTAANKLRDHLLRQLPSRLSENQTDNCDEQIPTHQCPRCFRICGSQALLRKHINQHVNKIKCPHCDMTLHGNHAVRRHILFRHSTERPVECSHCDRRFKDHGCLESHISWCHKDKLGNSPEGSGRLGGANESAEANPSSSAMNFQSSHSSPSTCVMGPLAAAGATKLSTCASGSPRAAILGAAPASASLPSAPETVFSCPHNPNCSFKARCRQGLGVHLKRVHPVVSASDVYACHLCQVRTQRSSELSRHLIRSHKLQRPSGHARFTYTPCSDGLFRLQLTRLDSVEVARALLGPQAVDELIEQANQAI
uniref:Histone H4 transcription factor n=3 Tax=Schistocephalus solidus TaxID=70667 RepID=A0A0V0J8Y3_SCHSO